MKAVYVDNVVHQLIIYVLQIATAVVVSSVKDSIIMLCDESAVCLTLVTRSFPDLFSYAKSAFLAPGKIGKREFSGVTISSIIWIVTAVITATSIFWVKLSSPVAYTTGEITRYNYKLEGDIHNAVVPELKALSVESQLNKFNYSSQWQHVCIHNDLSNTAGCVLSEIFNTADIMGIQALTGLTLLDTSVRKGFFPEAFIYKLKEDIGSIWREQNIGIGNNDFDVYNIVINSVANYSNNDTTCALCDDRNDWDQFNTSAVFTNSIAYEYILANYTDLIGIGTAHLVSNISYKVHSPSKDFIFDYPGIPNWEMVCNVSDLQYGNNAYFLNQTDIDLNTTSRVDLDNDNLDSYRQQCILAHQAAYHKSAQNNRSSVESMDRYAEGLAGGFATNINYRVLGDTAYFRIARSILVSQRAMLLINNEVKIRVNNTLYTDYDDDIVVMMVTDSKSVDSGNHKPIVDLTRYMPDIRYSCAFQLCTRGKDIKHGYEVSRLLLAMTVMVIAALMTLSLRALQQYINEESSYVMWFHELCHPNDECEKFVSLRNTEELRAGKMFDEKQQCYHYGVYKKYKKEDSKEARDDNTDEAWVSAHGNSCGFEK